MITRAYLNTKRIRDKMKTSQMTFDFGPGVNVITGKNGCGKTTFLQGLTRFFGDDTIKDVTLITKDMTAGKYYFPNLDTTDPENNKIKCVSSGMNAFISLMNTLSAAANVFVFDIPETCLDLDNLLIFKSRLDMIQEVKDKQVIMSTNSPILIDPDYNLIEIGDGENKYINKILEFRYGG